MPTKVITVGEVERLRPDSEYVRCYRNLCRETGRRFDPDLPYSELPKLLLGEGMKAALAFAFADIVLDTDLWSVRGPESAQRAMRRALCR